MQVAYRITFDEPKGTCSSLIYLDIGKSQSSLLEMR